MELSLWLTLLSKCSAAFLSIWGLLVRFQDSLRAFYCDPLWISQSTEQRDWHHIREKVVTSRYQMTLKMVTEGEGGQTTYSRAAHKHIWSHWNFPAMQGCQWSRWYKTHFKALGTMPKRCYLSQITDLVSHKAKNGTLAWRLARSWIPLIPNLSYLTSGLLMPWSLSIRGAFQKLDAWAPPEILWAWSLGLCILNEFARKFFGTPKSENF